MKDDVGFEHFGAVFLVFGFFFVIISPMMPSYISPSWGADQELKIAETKGIKIFRTLKGVPSTKEVCKYLTKESYDDEDHGLTEWDKCLKGIDLAKFQQCEKCNQYSPVVNKKVNKE